MLTLISNEFGKLFRRKKTIITLIIVAVLMGLLCFATFKMNQISKSFKDPKTQITAEESSLKYSKEERAKSGKSEQEKADLDKQIKETEQRIEGYKSELNAPKLKGNEKLDAEIAKIEKQQSSSEYQNLPAEIKENDNNKLKEYKYMKSNNIKLQEDMDNYSMLTSLIGIISGILLITVISILVADIVSGEFSPATMKFLLTQPVSRGRVLFSKFIAALVTSIVAIIAMELIVYVISGFIVGFGNINYPITIGSKYVVDMGTVVNGEHPLKLVTGSAYIISAGAYLVRLLLMQSLIITSIVAFAFLLSSIFNSSMISTSIAIVSVIALTIIEKIPYFKKIAVFLFTTHGDPTKTFNGQIATEYANPMVTPLFSIVVLSVWIIGCYAISHLIFTKRDLL